MIRKAFVMQVNPDAHEEYQRRHNPIWPELEAVLKATARTTTRFISIKSAICCSPRWRLNPKRAGTPSPAPRCASAGGSICAM
jgi:hypothetical protein